MSAQREMIPTSKQSNGRKHKRTNKLYHFEALSRSDTFTRLGDSMLGHAAWKDLKPNSIVLYIKLKEKFNGYNEKKLHMTYAESGMQRRVFQKAIIQLTRNGFIEIVSQGKFSKLRNIYALSENWHQYPDNKIVLPDWKQCGNGK